MHLLSCLAANRWIAPSQAMKQIHSAINNQPIAEYGDYDIDYAQILHHAQQTGQRNLGSLTFHDRAKILKKIALYLEQHKKALYELGYQTGATKADNGIDIDGGIATLFVYASKGRREMPDSCVYLDGNLEMLSRNGSFVGQHICTPKQGVAVQINAFNFPVWGMLEKFAQSFLAGVPCIVKPATVTAYLSHACIKLIHQSGLVPEGALHLIIGRIDGLMNLLGAQDSISFTGSAQTAAILKKLCPESVTFTAEQDSLNGAILGLDAERDSPEFDLFIAEATKEMTTKAGQKCTAMRRLIVPKALLPDVSEALSASLSKISIGDPREKTNKMGALVSMDQRNDVLAQCAKIATESRCILDGTRNRPTPSEGAYLAPSLYLCDNPKEAKIVHETEAFGPVATLMGYDTAEDACIIANMGGGSLVVSLMTRDNNFARQVAIGLSPWHGRIYINNRDSAKEATGHGSPLPHMIHGGPGRAGGCEEMGGIRGVLHHMQRTAIQGSPEIITAITGEWMKGAKTTTADPHPFRQTFHQLTIGTHHQTQARIITAEDIAHFAEFTGDKFYAHTDEAAASANPFFPSIVAHGYLLLSFAAGLFVDPEPGPVLANTGLTNLSFQKPIVVGDSIYAQLTVQKKTPRNTEYGEVRWHVEIRNQKDELVAEYQLLTMNSFSL